MAQLISSQGKQGNKRKRTGIHLDFSPFVGLGFMLVCFFLLRARLVEDKVMEVQQPEIISRWDMACSLRCSSSPLTLLLHRPGKVYYYQGITEPSLDSTNFSEAGLRQMILQKRSDEKQKWGDPNELVVFIKPGKESNYSDLVNALDEMQICGVKRHLLWEMTPEEEAFISQPEEGLYPELN